MVYYGCHGSVSSFKTQKTEKSAYRQEVVFLWSQTQQQFGAGTFWSQAAGVGDGAVFGPVLLRREPHHPGQNTHVSLRLTLQIGFKKKKKTLTQRFSAAAAPPCSPGRAACERREAAERLQRTFQLHQAHLSRKSSAKMQPTLHTSTENM